MHQVKQVVKVRGDPVQLAPYKCQFVAAFNALTGSTFPCTDAAFKNAITSEIYARRLAEAEIVLEMTAEYESREAADAASAGMTQPSLQALQTQAEANLQAQGVDPPFTILDIPPSTSETVTKAVLVSEDYSDASSEDEATGAVVGGIIGGLAVVGLAVGGYMFWQKKSKVTSVVPA